MTMNFIDRKDITATMKRLGICVIVPTYNNAASLASVLDGILEYTDDVIIVNDGSTDETPDILDAYEGRIKVVVHERNRGKGDALVSGFRAAKAAGYVTAITIDSDGQHYPSDLPGFVEAIARNPESIIIGERDLSRVDINGKSSFANKFSNFWFCIQTGRYLRDTQTGYRAYPLNLLGEMKYITSRYEAELEFLVLSSWKGIDIVSIPINVYYPPQDERVSHFHPAKDFTRISILNTILCLIAIFYGLPRRLFNSVRQKRLFNFDFRKFTHSKGIRREAALTMRRIFNTTYSFTFFVTASLTIFTPFALIYFGFGKITDKKRLKFHKALQKITKYIATHYPDAPLTVENPHNERFEKPSLIICNHQSLLDLPILMALTPKLIFLTNERVWGSKVYGRIIRNAEFLPISAGVDKIYDHLDNLKKRGYSIMIFPEGTRSETCRILRFHQGAFLLAQKLNLDIVPLTLHGVGHILPKNEKFFRKGKANLHIGKRVNAADIAGMTTLKQASMFRHLIRERLEQATRQFEDTAYFSEFVKYKYAYRGWKTVSECKKTLAICMRHKDLIEHGSQYRSVRITESGIGVFALLYALVNKGSEVHAYESSDKAFHVASATPGLPPNLHLHHAVRESEFGKDEDFDITIKAITCNVDR